MRDMCDKGVSDGWIAREVLDYTNWWESAIYSSGEPTRDGDS